MSSRWVKIYIIMVFYETQIKTGVNGESPWGRHKNKNGRPCKRSAVFVLNCL
jgi:hypothetical protein